MTGKSAKLDNVAETVQTGKENITNALPIICNKIRKTLNITMTINICKVTDVGKKVYLHTYNNKKNKQTKNERDRFIKKVPGVEPVIFRSPD